MQTKLKVKQVNLKQLKYFFHSNLNRKIECPPNVIAMKHFVPSPHRHGE